MIILSPARSEVFQKHLLSVTSKHKCSEGDISKLIQTHCASIHEKFPPTTSNWDLVINTLIDGASIVFHSEDDTVILTICSDVYENSGWKTVVHRLYFGSPQPKCPDITIDEAI